MLPHVPLSSHLNVLHCAPTLMRRVMGQNVLRRSCLPSVPTPPFVPFSLLSPPRAALTVVTRAALTVVTLFPLSAPLSSASGMCGHILIPGYLSTYTPVCDTWIPVYLYTCWLCRGSAWHYEMQAVMMCSMGPMSAITRADIHTMLSTPSTRAMLLSAMQVPAP